MLGLLATAPSQTTGSGLRLSQGVDPLTPTNGDVWITASGFYIRANNTTYNLSGGPIACSQLPALVGDIISTAGSCSTTLKVVNGSPGTYGGTNKTLSAVVDQYGRITGLSVSSIAITLSQVTDSGTAAAANLGTSGATLGRNSDSKTDSGNNTYSGANVDTGSRDMSGASSVKVPTVATADASTAAASTANVAAKIAAATAAIPRGYLSGLTTANNATNPTTQLDVAPGMATSDDNLVSFGLASTITKTMGAWAAGAGNGGLDTGTAAANTWYHVFVIYNPTTLASDVLFSTSATAPTLPTNYTKKRRIGSILTTGTATNITAFVQTGDEFVWVTPIQNANGVAIASGASASQGVSVPPGLKVSARLAFVAGSPTANATLTAYPPDASGTNGDVFSGYSIRQVVANSGQTGNANILTDTAQTIRLKQSVASGSYSVTTNGYIDTRGR